MLSRFFVICNYLFFYLHIHSLGKFITYKLGVAMFWVTHGLDWPHESLYLLIFFFQACPLSLKCNCAKFFNILVRLHCRLTFVWYCTEGPTRVILKFVLPLSCEIYVFYELEFILYKTLSSWWLKKSLYFVIPIVLPKNYSQDINKYKSPTIPCWTWRTTQEGMVLML